MKIDNQTLIEKLTLNKNAAFKFQQRRHEEWTENYALYRDKVVLNRLTQRQSVNVPLMKETIKTILSKTDDAPDLKFEELTNDKQKEIFLNEYFDFCAEDNKLEIKDIIDKKQVFLFGRSFKKLNIVNGKPYVEIIDPQDILVDQYADPADLDTAQYMIHQHIFRTLKEIENNPIYDKNVITRLKVFYATEQGLVKAAENAQSLQGKNQKMQEMGVPDISNPLLGETYLELNENYTKLWDEEKEEFIIYLIIKIDNEILLSKPLEEIIGKTKDNYWRSHYPLSSWADDVERLDIWSDAVADMVRTPNKIINAWFSQLVENRTLRNFGMNYYDATVEGFTPQTFEPVPFGWYPVPGKPQDVFQKVDIPDLSESLDELSFIIGMVERASAATAIEKGMSGKGQITLGEVQILTARANERIVSISKFYRQGWKDFGEKWVKLVEAQMDNLEVVNIYKKSFNGIFFKKEVSPKDWKSETGYKVRVLSSAEQEQETLENIQKLNAVKSQMPDNEPLKKIYDKKLLDLAGLSPDEIKEVMDFEEQKKNVAAPMMPAMPMMPNINKQLLTTNA